jgi:predicted ABC-type ATPase
MLWMISDMSELLKQESWEGKKVIYVFAGPNGSGKSTIVDKFLDGSICPSHIICPDNFVAPEDKDKLEPYIEAMQKAEAERYLEISVGRSYSMETVLSTTSKRDFIKYAKQQGYKIVTIYVTTADPNINVERVQLRVSQGGHDVPRDKIFSRYEKSLDLMYEVACESDLTFFFDNSGSAPTIVASKIGSVIFSNNPCDWFGKYIITKAKDDTSMIILP